MSERHSWKRNYPRYDEPAIAAVRGFVAAKRARGSDGRFVPSGAEAGGEPAPEDPIPEVLQSVASQINDPEVVRKLYGAAARMLKAVEEKHNENEKLLQERAIMEKAAAETKENSKVFAKQSIKEITGVLGKLFKHAKPSWRTTRPRCWRTRC